MADNIAQDLLQLLNGANSTSASYSVSTSAGASSIIASAGSASYSASGSASYSASASGSASASASAAVLSQIELAILRSTVPIEINESEEITVIGQRGVWVNKAEVSAWKGDLAISEYKIYEDSNPEIITKKVTQLVEYVQELAIRYLRPPTPPAPGEIIISVEANGGVKPAPPLIIRQQPARASTPEPLVIREAPPQPPVPVGPKRITISGKTLPPPPRKVVIERLAPLPSKPQNVIVERWLPYSQVKRRVIFNKAAGADVVVANPRNVIVQWEAPQVNIKKEIKYLGVIRANPVEYVQRYGAELKISTALPQFVLDIATPNEVGVLAADYKAKASFELEGQLEGFAYVNLDKEGLSEYRAFLLSKGIKDLGAGAASSSASFSASASGSAGAASFSVSGSASGSASASVSAAQIFAMIDVDNSGSISVEETGKILLKLNSRFQRSYGENNITELFKLLDVNGDGKLNLKEFTAIFNSL